MSVLPNNILKCLDKDTRASLGKPGRLIEEINEAVTLKSEKVLQQQIAALLRRECAIAFQSPFGRKSRMKAGMPDFIAAIKGQAIAIEAKIPGGLISKEQADAMTKMMNDGWRVCVAYSYSEALDFINRIKEPNKA